MVFSRRLSQEYGRLVDLKGFRNTLENAARQRHEAYFRTQRAGKIP